MTWRVIHKKREGRKRKIDILLNNILVEVVGILGEEEEAGEPESENNSEVDERIWRAPERKREV